jgi:hypothetical protein
MYTLAQLAKNLNRSLVYVSGLQARFELPVFEGAAYSEAYLVFLQSLVNLRTLSIAEETLRDLWHIEKKLMQLLQADTSSPTWFLDSCGVSARSKRRLLLTNYKLGSEIQTRGVQLGLHFTKAKVELFAGHEMGEDALRVLEEYDKLHTRILTEVKTETPTLRDALAWAKKLG